MVISLPKLIIASEDKGLYESKGMICMLSLGFALFQTWWISLILGGRDPVAFVSLFDASFSFSPKQSSLLIAQIASFLCLTLMVYTDQTLLKLYSSRRTLIAGALFSSLGTLGIFLTLAHPALSIVRIACCIFVGIGGSVIIMFWGVAYSRHSLLTILINSSIAAALTFCILFLLSLVPALLQTALLSLLPLLCLPLLWNFTPISYAIRHSIPIFNPLPVNTAMFSIRLTIPTILIAVTFYCFLHAFSGFSATSEDFTVFFLLTLFGALFVIVVSATELTARRGALWDHCSRTLTIIILICALFLPSTTSANPLVYLFVIVGCMMIPVFLWVFCGQIAQGFRISPILIFSEIHSGIIVGFLLCELFQSEFTALINALPIETHNIAPLVILGTSLAYLTFPRAQDIKRVIVPLQEDENNAVGDLNRELQRIFTSTQKEMDDLARSIRNESPRVNAPGQSTHTEQPSETLAEPSTPAAAIERTVPEPERGSGAIETAGEEYQGSGKFRLRCETVANTYMLSRRETEVMFLLAKGYSTNRIMEELFISRSTAKTHIAHIYTKLSIHSRQELQSVVETSTL